jgi:uncharacterized protein
MRHALPETFAAGMGRLDFCGACRGGTRARLARARPPTDTIAKHACRPVPIYMSTPAAGTGRIAIVDALRGWALLSVVLINFSIFYSFGVTTRIPADDTVSRIAKLLTQVFFQDKGWTLLAFLFGYGFSVLIERLKQDAHPARAFSRRMFWLLIIALVNCALYYGDVLKDYVMVGMIILLFHRVTSRTAGLLALGCLLAFPALIAWSRGLELASPIAQPDLDLYRSGNLFDVLKYGLLSGARISTSFTKLFDWNLVMLACAFAGMACQRARLFETLHERRLQLKYWCLGALAFAISSAAVGPLLRLVGVDSSASYELKMWPMLGQMVCFMAALCWLYVTARLPRVFESLRFVGRMTLTNYLVQNLIGMLLFSGFGLGLMHRMPYWAHTVLALVVFAVQIVFSRYWLMRHPLGPVEWIWRKLSARRVIRRPVTSGGVQCP